MSAPARTFPVNESAVPLTWRQTVGAYVALTKPRIIELLLVTTFPAMVVAADGLPNLWLALATLIGGSLAAGGANTINCYIDRDIDAIMRRTHSRPIPAGLIKPSSALIFGISLSVIAFVFLTLTVNLLTACLAVSAILVVYGVRTILNSAQQGAIVFKSVVFPEWWLYTPVPLCFGLLAVEFVRRFAHR